MVERSWRSFTAEIQETPADDDRQVSAPPLEELMSDWRWAADQRAAGAFGSYVGRHVAVFDAEVVADGDDPAELRVAAAREKNVDPERIAVLYVDSPDDVDQPME